MPKLDHLAVLFALSLTVATPALAQSAPPAQVAGAEAEEAALRTRLAALETQLRALVRLAEIERDEAAERSRQATQSAAGRGGFSVQSADGSFRLRVRGLIHSDGRFFVHDTEDRAVDSFLLRRVRPILDASVYRQFDFRIVPDFGNGTTTLQDAYVEARLRPALNLRVGKFKVPVGLERLTSAAEMTFIERALPTLLVPNRDVGVMMHGDLFNARLAFAGGLFNGVADGGSADADSADGKDLVGRLFAQPFRHRRDSAWRHLGAGLALSYGQQHGVSASSTGLPTLRTSGQQVFFSYRGDDPILGPVRASGTHARLTAQGHYYVGQFGLLAEHVLSRQDVRRAALAGALDTTAWQIAGSWVLTGETPSFRGVVPRTSFDVAARTWGSLELTARYSALRVDRDAFPIFADPATATRGADAWTTGVNWILNPGVKVQLNFERTTFDASGANRRRPENSVLMRVQLGI